MSRLLSVSVDAKTRKGELAGYLTGIMYLSPHTSGGIGNLCPNASPGCIAACLNTAGRGVFNSVQEGRKRRTEAFKADREAFMSQLVAEVTSLIRKADRLDLTPLVRLNGTSDIPWENVPCGRHDGFLSYVSARNIMALFPSVQFYDYTKNAHRARRSLRLNDHTKATWPRNYHLTFSRSECNEADSLDVLRHGGNVAVVFSTARGESLPTRWNGYVVIDGDINDARPSDAYGHVIGLRAKGRARRDSSGFVVQVGG